MEDRKLNEKESLELIASMIQNTRNKIEKNCGTPFLIWGYTTVIVCFTVLGLVQITHNYHWNWLWFILPAIGFPATYFSSKRNPSGITTYVDRVITYIWWVVGAAGFIPALLAFTLPLPILFLILLLMGMGTTLTGLVLNFSLVTTGGIIGMLASIICLFLNYSDQFILFGVTFIFMMIIPGHILNHAARKQSKGVKEYV